MGDELSIQKVLDGLIRSASSGNLPREEVASAVEATGLTREDIYNAVAVEVARRFDAGRMDYEDSDACANALHGRMITDPEDSSQIRMAHPAYEIFLAFDAGEWDRADGSDPVEEYTRPEIRSILAGLEADASSAKAQAGGPDHGG